MTDEHDRSLLGAYTLGVLGADEARTVEAHLKWCTECRAELAELNALRDSLGEVPPEAFLDGPPDGGDLLLRRTLRAVRAEKARTVRRRTALVAAGIALVASATLGGGVLIGRSTVSTVEAQETQQPPGVVNRSTQDPGTGARLTVAVIPAAGWVRIRAQVTGVPAGTQCQIVVRNRDGSSVVAGSWLVSPVGERDGTILDGSALVPPAEVASVDVVTLDGRSLVSARV